MAGAILLAGSGEFTPAMVGVDEILLRHTPGAPPRVTIVPTASGLEGAVPFDWIARGVGLSWLKIHPRVRSVRNRRCGETRRAANISPEMRGCATFGLRAE